MNTCGARILDGHRRLLEFEEFKSGPPKMSRTTAVPFFTVAEMIRLETVVTWYVRTRGIISIVVGGRVSADRQPPQSKSMGN